MRMYLNISKEQEAIFSELFTKKFEKIIKKDLIVDFICMPPSCYRKPTASGWSESAAWLIR